MKQLSYIAFLHNLRRQRAFGSGDECCQSGMRLFLAPAHAGNFLLYAQQPMCCRDAKF